MCRLCIKNIDNSRSKNVVSYIELAYSLVDSVRTMKSNYFYEAVKVDLSFDGWREVSKSS